MLQERGKVSYSLMGTEFPFGRMKKKMEINSGDSRTTVQMYLMLLYT